MQDPVQFPWTESFQGGSTRWQFKMTVQFSCRGERRFARKRWLESLPFTRKTGQTWGELSVPIFALIFSWAKRTSPTCSFSVFTAISESSFLSVKRFLNARSRAGTLNRISSGQSLRNDCYCFRVILTKLLVRICSLKQLYVGVKIPHCSLGSIMDPFFEKRRISYCVVRRRSASFTLPLPSYESHALQLESIWKASSSFSTMSLAVRRAEKLN